jgi:hypothetical protein
MIPLRRCRQLDPAEISEGKFWKVTDIESLYKKNVFTPNFEYEFRKHIHTLLNNIFV